MKGHTACLVMMLFSMAALFLSDGEIAAMTYTVCAFICGCSAQICLTIAESKK